MKHKRISLFLSVIILAIGLIAAGCSGEEPPVSTGQLPENEQEETKGQVETKKQESGSLQSFTAVTLDGGTFTQEDIQGKDVTVINFWATYCGPCLSEMPDLAEFAGALPENVQVVTVCLDGAGDQETAERILSEAGYEGVTLLSGDGDFLTLCGSIRYVPTTVFVDGEGNLWGEVIIGGQTNLSEAFLKQVNALLQDRGKEEISLEK